MTHNSHSVIYGILLACLQAQQIPFSIHALGLTAGTVEGINVMKQISPDPWDSSIHHQAPQACTLSCP